MTSTNATSNRPTHELYFVEERILDKALSAASGRTHVDGETMTVWHKVGVAFATQKGNSNILIGKKGDKAQRRLLLVYSSSKESVYTNPGASRVPVADVFEADGSGNIDFQAKSGVAFLNRDESLTLVLGDKSDLEQVRYQMRAVRPERAFADRSQGRDDQSRTQQQRAARA